MYAWVMWCAFGECGDGGRKPPFPARADAPRRSAPAAERTRRMALRRTPSGIVLGMESRSRVDLPPQVKPPYEVFVNGVPQAEGTDYTTVGPTLLFSKPLAKEGRLGFWRWLSMLLGVAGTYRKNDNVTIVYNHNGKRLVAILQVTGESS